MRWILIILLMCNGIFFLWHNYMLNNKAQLPRQPAYQNGPEVQKTIVLLSEREPDEKAAVLTSGSNVEDPQKQLPPPPPICWLIGPFKEMVTGKQVAGRLEALNISLRLINLAIDGPSDYWVHLPPNSSRRSALKLLRELQTKKIDSFLITKGELENGISLGFFTQQDRAKQVFEDRVKQGYNARIKEVPRTSKQIWAVFDTGEYGKLSDELWERIKEGNSGLQRQKNYCDKIASVDDLD